MTDDLDRVREVFAAAEDIPGGEGVGEGPQLGPEGVDDGRSAPRTPMDGTRSDLDADLMRRAAGYPLNDYGNGQRVALHFGRDLMFVPRVGWFVWDGTRWGKDPDLLNVRTRTQSIAEFIAKEVDYIPKSGAVARALDMRANLMRERSDLAKVDETAREDGHDDILAGLDRRIAALAKQLEGHFKSQARVVTHAKNAGNNGPLKHMREEAETLLAQPLDRLDAHPLSVNCETALLRFRVDDLREEGAGKVAAVEALPHARDQLQTKKMSVPYDKGAACPLFDAFLEEMQPDREVRAFLQRWFGLSMTGLPVQRMVFFHGNGANGKSVLVDLMAKIMGDYSATVRIESLTGTTRRGGGDATPDLVPLIGARFARTSEPDQGTRLQEGLIKELTGGEPIMVRALHSDFIEIRPIFKLTMSGNHKPEIRGTDDGIWRRVVMVPWNQTIAEDRRNPHLVDDLMGEAPGILNWLIDGLMDYLEGGLSPPASITHATAEYRKESDPLGQFLEECCTCDGSEFDTLTTKRLKDGFDLWLTEQGLPVWKGRTFHLSMTKRSGTWKHPDSGWGFAKGPNSKQSHYVGIRFVDEFRERLDETPSGGGWRSRAAPDPDEGQ